MKRKIIDEFPKIRVVLRTDKKSINGGVEKYLLNYYITFRGETIKKATGIAIEQKNWDNRLKCVKNAPETRKINGELVLKMKEFTDYFVKLDAIGIKISRELIDDYFIDKKLDGFFSYYKNLVKERFEMGEIKDNTKDIYDICINRLEEFCKKKKIKNVSFFDITLSLITDFEKFLIYEKNLAFGTVNNYHKCLKYVLGDAFKREILTRSPYVNFKALKYGNKIDKVPLNPDELQAIVDLKIPREKKVLNDTKSIFLLMCYTGLRYSDIHSLNLNNRKTRTSPENKGTIHYIEIIQTKTKNPVEIPLFSGSKTILNLFKSKSKDKKNGFVVPKITNQVLNRNLKLIALECGIEKNLTCHMARHTYACMLLNRGVDFEYVSTLLGHTDLDSTRVYAKHDKNKVLASINVLETRKKIA